MVASDKVLAAMSVKDLKAMSFDHSVEYNAKMNRINELQQEIIKLQDEASPILATITNINKRIESKVMQETKRAVTRKNRK